MSVTIDYHACKGCKSCYNQCPADVFAWDPERDIPYTAYPDECSYCGICKMECPEDAIDLRLPLEGWLDFHKRFISKLSLPSEIRWPEDKGVRPLKAQ